MKYCRYEGEVDKWERGFLCPLICSVKSSSCACEQGLAPFRAMPTKRQSIGLAKRLRSHAIPREQSWSIH